MSDGSLCAVRGGEYEPAMLSATARTSPAWRLRLDRADSLREGFTFFGMPPVFGHGPHSPPQLELSSLLTLSPLSIWMR
jgi:hypothetical protein